MSQPSDTAPSAPPTAATAAAEKPGVRDKVAENLTTTGAVDAAADTPVLARSTG